VILRAASQIDRTCRGDIRENKGKERFLQPGQAPLKGGLRFSKGEFSMIGIKRLAGFLLALAVVAVVGCAGTATSRSTGTYIDDKTITTQVVAKLAADPATKAIQIKVETYNGVVQLSGFVDTKESIPKAEEIARSVEGVKDVKNNLALR
jgi:hypothetical protein